MIEAHQALVGEYRDLMRQDISCKFISPKWTIREENKYFEIRSDDLCFYMLFYSDDIMAEHQPCYFYKSNLNNLNFIIKNIDKFKNDKDKESIVCIDYPDLLSLLGMGEDCEVNLEII